MHAENNKIIAKFMSDLPEWKLMYVKDVNYSFYINPWSSKANTYDEKMSINGFYLVPTCIFNFHSDWNWLMPVVEKIKQSLHNSMESRSEAKQVLDSLRNVDKQDTYNACVAFIKWYNQQLK